MGIDPRCRCMRGAGSRGTGVEGALSHATGVQLTFVGMSGGCQGSSPWGTAALFNVLLTVPCRQHTEDISFSARNATGVLSPRLGAQGLRMPMLRPRSIPPEVRGRETGEDYRFPSVSTFVIVMSRLGEALNVFDTDRRNYPFPKAALCFHNMRPINVWKTNSHQATRQCVLRGSPPQEMLQELVGGTTQACPQGSTRRLCRMDPEC